MIDKFCDYLTEKIKKEMPELDVERAEVINYGIHLIIGELPKILLLFVIGFLIGKGKETLFTFLIFIPYKAVAGGVHMKSHIGCILFSCLLYLGTIMLSTISFFETQLVKYIAIGVIWVFGMIMIYLYAPADTEELPILRKKERKIKKILSYIILTIMLIISAIINNEMYSNILWIGTFLQTVTITRLIYVLTNNKYGFETYNTSGQTINLS